MILGFVVDATEDVLGVTRLHHVALTGFEGGGGFWGVILGFVVDATEDVLGVTRLHHVALTGFGSCEDTGTNHWKKWVEQQKHRFLEIHC